MKGLNLSEWAIRHRALVLYFMLMSVVAGVYAYLQLGRNEDPSFTVKVMVVQTYWPGATQDDTMRQVTDRIEKKLQETPHLDFLRSYTTAGQSTVFITLRQDTPKDLVEGIWYQVRKKVGDIQADLPTGVQGPFFNDEFSDTFGIIYGFTADGFSHRELRDYVEQARAALLRVPDVAKVEVIGAQDERVYVEFSARRLAQLGLDSSALIRTLQAQNAVLPAGTIPTGQDKIQVQVSGKLQGVDDLAAINIAVGQRMLRLSDVATLHRGYADPPQPRFRVNGQAAIGLALSMRDGGDMLALGDHLSATMAQVQAELPAGVTVHLVANQAQIVHDAVGEFTKALWEAIAIVLAISFISLGLRAGSVVALSIPLVLAVVFIVMKLLGIDLQRVSLGALIIALGLLVDDAMITVESMVTRLERGWDKVRAATFAYTSTAFPMLTGTLVTVIGFVPIGFSKSDAGEYTFSLFAVVAIALMVSWIVAVLFSPLIGTWVLRQQPAHHVDKPRPLMDRFRKLLVYSMRHAKVTIALILGLFVLALALLPLVPQQFFPSSDRPELMVGLQLKQDASIYATDEVAKKLDGILAKDPDVAHWSSYVGRGAVRFYLPLDVQLQNDFFTEAVVVAKDAAARERLQARLAKALEEQLPEAQARIAPLELGPPVGWPVQYRISGADPQRVRAIAQQLAGVLGKRAELQKISFNWMEPVRQLRIQVDQDEARRLGMNSASIAQAINTVLSGDVATQLRDDTYLVNVLVRAQANERLAPQALATLDIPLPNGRTVPLATLARVEYGQDLPLIWRRDRLPTLTVQADITGHQMPATVVAALKDQVDAVRATLPAGYQINVGGSVEESARSEASVVAVVPVMLILMLTVLMIQMQNFHHLFLVISVAPLGLIGVVLALLGLQQPLGFVALLGVVALIGMIVRNSVILVHQIETEMHAGRHPWEAVVEASLLRFRPIMLTSVTAILGMLPIAPTVFWGPMANAIMGGLAVATVLTLIFLPSLYITWFRIHEPTTDQPAAHNPAQEVQA